MNDDIIASVLITLLIIIVIFLILREIVCWYWKINRIVDLQEKQNILLEKLVARLVDEENTSAAEFTDNTEESSSSNDDDISRDNLFK